ncbi:HNH endonuclease [Peredibacter starrii]|uniref:HNH endonuclease n=1 Tax=Peredibacter starrii TaxID=28202 RepID=UPI00389A3C33
MGDIRKKRFQLWRKSDRICFVCRNKIEYFDDSSIEHIVPLSEGGNSSARNLTLSHRRCNNLRGSIICRIVWELRIKTFKPKERPYYEPPIVKELKTKEKPTPKDIEAAWIMKMMEKYRHLKYNLS